MRFKYWASLWVLIWLSFFPAWGFAAIEDNGVKLTGANWTRSVDAVTGLVKVRLTLDTSKPIEAEQFLTRVPNWRLIVTLKGTAAAPLKISPSPDTVVVSQMNVIQTERDSRVVIDFPEAVTAEQYKVFSTPADARAKRPNQVVIEIWKKVPLGDLKFLPGLRGKLIVLDPGHGGSDPGAIGVRGSREKQINLDLAMLTKKSLEKAGAKVRMTRETDIDVFGPNATDREELMARVLVGNNNKADVFVSIHHNSSVNREANGTTTYYYSKTLFDGELARSLQDAMVHAGGLADKGARTANFFVVKNTTMPAALLEVGFMSNPQEELTICDPDFQQKIAQAVVTGIDQFFTQAAKLRGEQ